MRGDEMAKLLSKLFPKSRKRIKPGLEDGSRWRIYEAGWMALNDADHEDVSIVHVAKTAGVSNQTKIPGFRRSKIDQNEVEIEGFKSPQYRSIVRVIVFMGCGFPGLLFEFAKPNQRNS
jgi:hypothetical protein